MMRWLLLRFLWGYRFFPFCSQLIQSLLMPSVDNRESAGLEFQSYFVQCGGLKLFLSIVTDKNFMVPGDVTMKRCEVV